MNGAPTQGSLVLLVTVLGSCASDTRPDAEVYAVVLEQSVAEENWAGAAARGAGTEPIRELVILGEPERENGLELPDDVHAGFPSADASLFEDFEERALDLTGLAEIEISIPHHLLDRQQASTLLEQGWSDFYERYPEAPGLFGFSGIGYSDEGHQALVYMVHYRSGHQAYGRFYLLGQVGDAWAVLDRRTLWEA